VCLAKNDDIISKHQVVKLRLLVGRVKSERRLFSCNCHESSGTPWQG